MSDSDQTIKSGDASNIIQTNSGNVTVNHGLSIQAAKELFDILFKENFLILQKEAAEIVYERSQKLINTYLSTLQKEAPDEIESSKDPDMQYIVYKAQKAYARSGKKDLQELLVNLLVSRAKANNEELEKVVLNEALITASKVTQDQIDAITIVFILAYTRKENVTSQSMLVTSLNPIIEPFLVTAAKSVASFQHIEYASCGTSSIGSRMLPDIFLQSYPGLFSKGFSLDQFRTEINNQSIESKLLINCLNDSTKHQERGLDSQVMKDMYDKNSLSVETAKQLENFFNTHRMSADEVKNKLSELWPIWDKLLDYWTTTNANCLNLTSVAIAIAIANIKRKTGHTYDLNIWIK